MPEPLPENPYLVLGVSKDATTAEIKAAHRKLALKCHPDKIKDEEQRKEAIPEFQRVQSAYELLSDDRKRADYDRRARDEEQRRKSPPRNDDAGSSSFPRTPTFTRKYEYRDGACYEERVPKSSQFFDEDIPFTQEPRPSSRKYDGYEKRQNVDEKEKKKSKSTGPSVSARSTKERAREAKESAKTNHWTRAKTRDKERKKDREHSEKHSRPFVVTEAESESDDGYDRPESPAPQYEGRRRGSTRPRFDQSRDEEYVETKLDDAVKYIQRSKSGFAEHHHSASYPSSGYHDVPVDTARRSSGRPRTRESVRPSSSGRDRRGSVDPLKSHSSRPPTLQTANTAPAASFFMPIFSSRSASKTHPSPPRRSESTPFVGLSRSSRSSKVRDTHDSGYSSPSTPDMHSGTSPPLPGKYAVVEESDEYREIHIAPTSTGSYRQRSSASPPHRPSGPNPLHSRSATYSSPMDPMSSYHDSSRSIPTSRTPPYGGASQGRLFGETITDPSSNYKIKIPSSGVRYSHKYRREDVSYVPNRYQESYSRSHPSVREDTVAY
ncbi:hypothetical protein AJ79_00898 [Helicocarpus griseus UAMH5409]|uniref:J domain-containing protein n=1 Tax=Helicocarpus griseus UAMH5409 TaxID=1447875 RepID=A0A2B7YAY0_9EURO|nr:hypothetical protein AJ79_00898 [Helicocarpus griseus UAMH5409]